MSLRSNAIMMAGGIAIVVFTIVITNSVQSQTISESIEIEPQPTFSQVMTFGPVWTEQKWVCISDRPYTIDAVFRGIGENPQIKIQVQGSGTQSFLELEPSQLESFSVGAGADKEIQITRTGTVTGFLTLHTMSDATASCIQEN